MMQFFVRDRAVGVPSIIPFWISAFSLVLTGLPHAAAAQSADMSMADLSAGDQVSQSGVSGIKVFAGNTIELTDFAGVFGMSSDTAYVVIASGHATIGEMKAKPGEVLILTPYGGKPAKQTFDVSRFLHDWSGENSAQHPEVLAAFEKVQKKQARAIFLGLFQQTDFNVAAPGSASTELARRTVVGSPVVQSIRFSNVDDPAEVERLIVSAFRDALIAGDVSAVASLMDPTPFGGSDLRGGADGARLLAARQLIGSTDWQSLLSSSQFVRKPDSNLWALTNGQNQFSIQLRPVGDFTYISSIQREL